jgi:HD-GYP domain-containing protein (c-di-GMP phosphodiesterase class II)
MVRLIHMLKKGFKKSSQGSADLQEGLVLPQDPKPRPAASFDEPPSGENPFHRKADASGGSQEYLERFSGLADLYRELYAAVRFTMDGAIHREKIVAVVEKVADVFMLKPHNELLLIAYTFSKKNYLAAHMANDVILTVGFAVSLGYGRADVVDLGVCAFTHDLGMTGFDALARKAQQLTEQEIEDIKHHPLIAADLVRPIFSEKISSVLMDVHERQNGQGYPRGIPGSQIHMWAKIIAVCDTFEALTHPRVFRAPYSPYEAIKIIIKKKDVFFDDVIVKRFIDYLSIYPVGMLVYLNTGEMALVTGSNPGSPTRPVVRVLVNERREVEDLPRSVDLSEQNFMYITGVVEPDKEKEIHYFLKPRGQVELDEA